MVMVALCATITHLGVRSDRIRRFSLCIGTPTTPLLARRNGGTAIAKISPYRFAARKKSLGSKRPSSSRVGTITGDDKYGGGYA
jgi:hypothetical protein